MDIWDDWKEHYRTAIGIPHPRICKDGILDQAAYEQARRRVLFVLKETNDAPDLDLRQLLKNGPVFQMWHTVARWAVGILYGFPPFSEISCDRMKAALQQVAIINLKKLTGRAAADLSIVGAFALRDRHLLRRQISEIGPQIIVCCGTFEIVVWLLELDIGPMCPLDYSVTDTKTGAMVVPFRHPSRAGNLKTYEELEVRVRPLD